MAARQLVECSFLIPLRRDAETSDGRKHPAGLWKWLSDELYDRFGGRTRAKQTYDGLWRSSQTGLPVADESYLYFVAISKRKVPELRRLLREACVVFHQQSI
jgi:hypothetical protein